MTVEPMVSVIMPVYNGQDVIGRAIASILLQTYQNWELIIVNDGSTDNTAAILDKLNDSRIRVFHFTGNRGRPFARQRALDEARGEYLAMLDADDWYYPDKLEYQVKFLQENPAIVLLSCAMTITDKKGLLVSVRGNLKGETIKIVKNVKTGNLKLVPYAPSMIRMRAAKSNSFDTRFPVSEDKDFLIKILKGNTYAMSPDPLYVYSWGQSIEVSKMVMGYKLARKIWSKHLARWSWSYVKIYLLSWIKIGRARLYNAFGKLDALAISRTRPPTREELLLFNRNLKAVGEKVRSIV